MHWRLLVVRRSRSSRQIRRRWPEDATPCKCLHTFTNRFLFYVPIEVYKNFALSQITCLTRMTTAGAAAEHLSSSPSFTKLVPNQFMRDLIRQPLKCDSRGTLRSLGASCRGRWGPCPWLRQRSTVRAFRATKQVHRKPVVYRQCKGQGWVAGFNSSGVYTRTLQGSASVHPSRMRHRHR